MSQPDAKDEALFVRLKPYDPRQRCVLQRFTYRGIKFCADRGWYRVAPHVADYLRKVRQLGHDPHSPPAFDVCTEEEAQALDAEEDEAARPRRPAGRDIPVATSRRTPAVTSGDLPATESAPTPSGRSRGGRGRSSEAAKRG